MAYFAAVAPIGGLPRSFSGGVGRRLSLMEGFAVMRGCKSPDAMGLATTNSAPRPFFCGPMSVRGCYCLRLLTVGLWWDSRVARHKSCCWNVLHYEDVSVRGGFRESVERHYGRCGHGHSDFVHCPAGFLLAIAWVGGLGNWCMTGGHQVGICWARRS